MTTVLQRQKIGYLRKLLGLEDDLYYEMIAGYNGAKSSKDLSISEGQELLSRLRDVAQKLGLFKPYASTKFKSYKYNNLGKRSGMASPAQLRKIEAMWADVSRARDSEGRAKALGAFIKRITGRDSILFITSADAVKLINALEAMGTAEGKGRQ